MLWPLQVGGAAVEMATCRVRVVLFFVHVKFFSPEPNPLSFRVEIYKPEPVY